MTIKINTKFVAHDEQDKPFSQIDGPSPGPPVDDGNDIIVEKRQRVRWRSGGRYTEDYAIHWHRNVPFEAKISNPQLGYSDSVIMAVQPTVARNMTKVTMKTEHFVNEVSQLLVNGEAIVKLYYVKVGPKYRVKVYQ